jgi:imidazolonepropionase-like amidohydrolase
MIDHIFIAAAAWLGADTLAGPTAVGVRGDSIGWIGTPAAAPPAVSRSYLDAILMPGFTDHHVHIALIDPAELLSAGVTTLVDLGGTPDTLWPLVERSQDDQNLPRIRAAGPFLTVPGGYPTRQEWAPTGIAVEVDDPRSAAEAVESLVPRRPATIKVVLNSEAGPVMDDATLRTVVRTAADHGIPVTAHTQGPGQTLRAYRAGVRVLAHTPWTETLPDELISDLARSTTIISTLDIHGWGTPTHERDIALHNLRRFKSAGGTVRYGTDLGNGPLPRAVNAREIAALTEAGLTPTDILHAITSSPLRPGVIADLTAVPSDPTRNPAALSQAIILHKAGGAHRWPSAVGFPLPLDAGAARARGR